MFIERDNDGNIKGVYANFQPGYAEEELADDHPEVVAFLNPEPDAVAIKKQAVLNASIDVLKSGGLNRVLWVSIESTIAALMQNPIVIAAGMDRAAVIAALTTEGSGYHNQDFADTYRHYNMLNDLIKGESA